MDNIVDVEKISPPVGLARIKYGMCWVDVWPEWTTAKVDKQRCPDANKNHVEWSQPAVINQLNVY